MIKVRPGFAALATMTMIAAVHAMGCIGGGCGVAPVPGPNSDNGAVTFDDVTVGKAQRLSVPFQDSADVDETITGASITGPEAAEFTVVSTFPIAVPAGAQASVELEFVPKHSGSATATLVLETQGMGPSPVDLTGTGVAPGG